MSTAAPINPGLYAVPAPPQQERFAPAPPCPTLEGQPARLRGHPRAAWLKSAVGMDWLGIVGPAK